MKKNGFIDGSPENGNPNGNQYGEFRRSGEAMHAGKIDPAPRCGGIRYKALLVVDVVKLTVSLTGLIIMLTTPWHLA